MTRLVAIWTGGLMAAAGVCGSAAGQVPAVGAAGGADTAPRAGIVGSPALPEAAGRRTAFDVPPGLAMRTIVIPRYPTEAPPAFVSGETTGSTQAPAHDAAPAPEAAAASPDAGEAHGGAGEGHGEGETVASGPPPTRPPMPFDIIRTLQFLQDQIARGNGRAIRIQAMLLRRFGPTLLAAERSIWDDPRNRRAAILFTLSGGPPDILRRLVAEGVFDDATKPIAEAALAYVSNDLKDAEKRFSDIDLSALEPSMAAHLSLVLGQLKQNDHPADAVAYLDRARLLAPGGLVEEAALRLEVVLVDKLGDHARVDNLARQYFDRYSRSSYVGNFQARFAMVYADRGANDPQAALAQVNDITARLDDANRRALLLAISRRSLVAGHLEFARLSGGEAVKIGGVDGEELQRGNLYAAAAGLAVTDPAGATAELQSIDRSKLHPADIDILDAASSVLSGMKEVPPDAPGSFDAAGLEPSPVFDRAQKLLDAVAGDLGEKSE